jgi:hypothetical protein
MPAAMKTTKAEPQRYARTIEIGWVIGSIWIGVRVWHTSVIRRRWRRVIAIAVGAIAVRRWL